MTMSMEAHQRQGIWPKGVDEGLWLTETLIWPTRQ